jgi:predicted phage terminase large subunit-like protein
VAGRRKKRQAGRYTADVRAKALAALVANGGNIHQTSIQLQISAPTLRRWRDQKTPAVAASAVPSKRDRYADIEAIAWMLLDAVPEKIIGAPLNQLISGLVALDKIQLLHQEELDGAIDPINLSKMTDEQLEQLERLTALLLGGSTSAAVPEQPVASIADGTVGASARAAAVEPVLSGSPLHTPEGSDRAANALDIPQLHRWFDEQLHNLHQRRGSRFAVIAPRESAKSTWVTLAYVLRCAVENREPYILLLSDSEAQAEKFLSAIKAELERAAPLTGQADGAGEPSPERALANAYPDACGEGPEWRTDRIRLKNGVVIESLGRGSKIRGRKDRQYRPTLIVIDDCQSNRDILSSTERQKTLNWFMQEVIPCGSETTNYISIGSALHRDAVSVRAQSLPGWVGNTFAAIIAWPERMDLWQEWELRATNLADRERSSTAADYYAQHQAEMERGGISFWPSYKPVAALMMKRAEIGPRRFLTEYQGIPGTPDGAEWPPEYFDRGNLWFTEWPQDRVYTIIALDPSKGRSDKPGDYQAHAIIALTRDGKLWVDCECHREPVPEMVVRAVELARVHRPHSLVVETNQGLDLLIPEFERSALACKLLIPLENVEHHGESKVARIRRLGSYLSRGQIRVRNSSGGRLLVDQLRDFPNGDHDDAPDALELGIRRLELLTMGR